MKNLKIFFIDDEYIEYLRKYDKRVAYNKHPNRPYVGIVYTYNDFNYFAPLSSPKEKYIKMKLKALDIFKIDNGNLGVVNINNMIPCSEEVLQEAIPNVKDIKYKKLLENQITYININKEILINKILNFQKRYRQGNLHKNILDRTCDFILLEEKCKLYKN